MKRYLPKVFACLIIFSVAGLGVWASGHSSSDILEIHFFDVGQGDAILARLPHSQDILIDGGSTARVSRELGRTLPFFDRFIDVVLLTHPDLDHITGLIDVVKNYRVGRVVMPPVSRTTAEYTAFTHIIERRHIPVIYAQAGQVLQFDSGITVKILSSGEDAQVTGGLPLNDSSIVAMMTYHEIDTLFTGDISSAVEYELTHSGESINAEILKVPHHGSRFSSSQDFVRAVRPSAAIISSGKGNRYGHPHAEVLERFAREQTEVFRTDTLGDITVASDGHTFEVITERK
jgi:competence protein ComEC